MFKKLKIGTKITALVIGVVLASVIVVSIIAYNLSKGSINSRYAEAINVVANLKAQKIETFFDNIKNEIQFGKELQVVQQKILAEANLSQKDSSITTEKKEALNTQLNIIVNNIIGYKDVKNVYLTDNTGSLLYQAEDRGQNIDSILRGFGTDVMRGTSQGGVLFSGVSQKNRTLYALAQVDGADARNANIGKIIYEINLNYIYNLVKDSTGLGSTGETMLVQKDRNYATFLSPSRHKSGLEKIRIGSRTGIPAQRSIRDKNTKKSEVTLDYSGEEVLATWRNIKSIDWGVTVKVDQKEVNEPTDKLFETFLIVGAVITLLSIVIGFAFSRFLIRPLLVLKDTINLLAKGILPDKLRQSTTDEIGEMTVQLNELVGTLKKTADFARQIGEGDYQANFKPVSDKDTLGIALLTMRDSIQQSAHRDDERNWIVTGLAEIGDILGGVSGITELGEQVIAYIAKKISAVQGAFYTVNDEDPEDVFLEMNASYAYNKKKYLNAKFKFAEGLVGQAAIEQATILRTEVPDDYVTITSGLLGDRKPKSILLTPLITDDGNGEKVYGVLEFAGFEKFNQREVNFVKEVSDLIARAVFNIKVRETTERHLKDEMKMRGELLDKTKALQQSAEITEATAEALRKSKAELEIKVDEVQQASNRTRLLLENASEVITIYDEDKTVKYISPSVEKILGYSQNEMIGVKDIKYVHRKGVLAVEQMFEKLIANPYEQETIQFSYATKQLDENGDKIWIWLEATGTNLLSDPAINGIVVNARDITERRRAESEQRMRGQMQALSENSPDLITRINKEGRVFYINPIIETYTGKSKDEYLQKHLSDIDLNEEIISSWRNILDEVRNKNKKINMDVEFPSIMGKRNMLINAIPEYNDQHNIESVLLVSHDITERKIIELDIQNKNKKITESINYAKRIQEAILPDTRYIQQYLEESFIMYRPRDVVSGDFPWFLEKNGDIYLAAVDCTGHGVPGALISLIGYFLLNNIVKEEGGGSPAEILDLLDEGVTRTLKQNESNNSTQDGMDIALCKINKEKNQLEYAGAHRPLYFTSKNELYEIKGNKFPIGGAQYKNRVRFTNTTINYEEGDYFFLFSDGFPDQFGGPKNKKFSPRRIREIIKNNANLGLSQVERVMDEEFDKWKANNKQTDDVLMIGIKF
ncbi:PAS domain S-box protein [uncultured Microscilla sp.]|uniref:PAS domain S-box protein n=1 Tax=uncultured Microscilla sp. TaxID=432653 RepID=UPI0026380258|nr:PAS domain S-box protein [uncultured Microscilla sp.]